MDGIAASPSSSSSSASSSSVAPPAEAPEAEPGTHAVITGLVNASKYNSKAAVIASFDDAAGRYKVKVNIKGGSKVLAVRRSNLLVFGQRVKYNSRDGGRTLHRNKRQAQECAAAAPQAEDAPPSLTDLTLDNLRQVLRFRSVGKKGCYEPGDIDQNRDNDKALARVAQTCQLLSCLAQELAPDSYRVFFKGIMSTSSSRCDPFRAKPLIYGHLDLPTVGSRVSGLYTLHDDPHDDGVGPRYFRIRGSLKESLSLAFTFNSTRDPSDYEGCAGDAEVKSSRCGSESEMRRLLEGIRSEVTLRGRCSVEWPSEEDNLQCTLQLTVQPRCTLEALHGAWSAGWRGGYSGEERGGDVMFGGRRRGGPNHRAGPHPSVLPASALRDVRWGEMCQE